MKLQKNNEINSSQWDDISVSNRFRSAFQTKQFYDLFNSIPDLKANVFAVEVDGNIKALCVVTQQKEKGIKGYFSRRAIIYGGPLLDHNKEVSEYLMNKVSSELRNKAIYIETRNLHDYSEFASTFNNLGWDHQAYLNFHLDCASETTVWNNLNTNRKRQIKKALASGVIIEEALSNDDVKAFYTILFDLYTTKIKKPLFELEYFLKFLKSSVGKILLVKYEGKIIGGIVCPILPNHVIYELYICGLDQEYKEQSPSVMATYAAIEYAVKHNLKYFDFMGAGKPDEDYGVRDFKAKFGGKMVEHGRFMKINNPLLYNLGKSALKLIKAIK